MRVVSWNMGCGSPRHTGRYRRARDEAWRVLVGLAPDIVFVQEALLDVPEPIRQQGHLVIQEGMYEGQDAGTAIWVPAYETSHASVLVHGAYVAAATVRINETSYFLASVHVDTTDQ